MAEKSKKDGGQRYDWEKIKRDYVSNPKLSLRDISKKYGIRQKTVFDKSKADNWFATKKKVQEEVSAKAIAKATATKANKLANEMLATEMLSSKLLDALNDPEQFNRYVVQETESYQDGTMKSETVEKKFEKLDTKAMKDIAQTLKAVEEMKRGFYNIMKAEQLERINIEKERLQLEKERLEWEKQKQAERNGQTDNGESYGVVLMPPVLGGDK